MTSRLRWTMFAALFVAPFVAEGQATPPAARSFTSAAKKSVTNEGVPESHLPPPGMCRIWINNVPPVQQPAPTDCASAIKNRPSNGRVIFAEDGGRDSKGEREKDAKSKGRDKDEKSARDRKESKPRRP